MAVQCGKVIICGGGIIGTSTAYYLAELGIAATVVERQGIACAASGQAGGFLALDWNDGSPIAKLARKSYALHAQLAEKFGAENLGYRHVNTLSVAGKEDPTNRPKAEGLPGWVDGNILRAGVLGDTETTSQVHPYKLTNAMMDSVKQHGGRVIKGVVEGVEVKDGKVQGVQVDGELMPADQVVLALGPWSNSVTGDLQLPAVSGQKYTSIIMRPSGGSSISNHMLFTNFKCANGRHVEPEVYPRPDGTVYMCGEPQPAPLPASQADIAVDPILVSNLKAVASSVSSALASAPVEATLSCYLPVSPDGQPLVGRVPGVEGLYIATGHSCWGILNGPATGLAMAELLVHGEVRSVDVSALDPARFVQRDKGKGAEGPAGRVTKKSLIVDREVAPAGAGAGDAEQPASKAPSSGVASGVGKAGADPAAVAGDAIKK